MRVAWAIPCRYVEVNDGLATIVGAGTNIHWVPAFPAVVGLMVAVHIAGSEAEVEDDHTVRSQVLGPSMEPVAPAIEGTLSLGVPSPLKPPGWEVSMTLPVAIQFPAPEEGHYTLEITISGRSETVPLLVQQGPPPGMAPTPES